MLITEMPIDDQPREKLLRFGSGHLSDAELLAIFLRTGIPGTNAVELARELLLEFGGLRPLFAANVNLFCSKRGLGKAKFVQLQAVTEMARRYFKAQSDLGMAMDTPQTAKQYIRDQLAGYQHEVFAVLYLNSRLKPIAFEPLFDGDSRHAEIDAKMVLRKILERNASAVIFSHNHPSGNAEPSQSDIRLTQHLKKVLHLVDIKVLDHLIVGDDVVSFAELGLL